MVYVLLCSQSTIDRYGMNAGVYYRIFGVQEDSECKDDEY